MRRVNIIALVVFVGLLVWVFTLGEDAIERIQRGALSVMGPFISGSGEVEQAVKAVKAVKENPAELRKELDGMVQELEMLRLYKKERDELYEENQILRAALEYVERSRLELVPARVVQRQTATWYSTISIDKGSDAGIAVDSPVIIPVGYEAALVGKVTVCGKNDSVVVLLTDEMCQVSAKVMGTTEQGIVSGQRGAINVAPKLKLRYLSKNAAVPVGREVMSTTVGGLFPPNLLLGKIIDVEKGALNSEATLEPVVDFGSLENVFVVIGVRE